MPVMRFWPRPGAFQQFGQLGEDRGGGSPGGGRSPTARPTSRAPWQNGSRSPSTARPCPLCQETFGHGRGRVGRAHAYQGRLVRCGDDQHRAGHALGAQVALHEFHHFAAAFADQSNDVDVGSGIWAIMPMSVDLPTPEPAMMPTRCPLPKVNRLLMERTPTSRMSVMRGRCNGLGGSA